MRSHTETFSPFQLDAALLLDIFDEPIVIQRNFLKLTGNLNTAMLLSWIVTLSQDQSFESDGWLRLTQSTWQQDTGLNVNRLAQALHDQAHRSYPNLATDHVEQAG